MVFRETDVRDSLATRLDLIEEGVQLVDTEVALPNAVGTKGFVDILGRDRLGNIVVIEVKRSDQTAREALQEVLKYVELLRREHGHPEHRLRLVIASTSWRELTAPFSALARFCPYPLLGVQLDVDEDGQVLSAGLVEGLPASMRGQISDEGLVLLWSAEDGRSSAWEEIATVAPELGMRDLLGAEIDYQGDSEKVIYPYGLALVPGKIGEEEGRAAGLLAEGEIAPGIGPEEITEGFDVDDAPSLEREALSRLSGKAGELSDGVEFLSAEKWVRKEQLGWVLSRLHRTGTFAASSYIEDEELARQIGGLDSGLNLTVMETVVNPDLRLAWDEAVLRSQLMLEGNPAWQHGLAQWLGERESEGSRDYALRIYHLQDIVRSMIGLQAFRDGRWSDTLKVLAGGETSPEKGLVGVVVWDGGGLAPLEAVKSVFDEERDQLAFALSIAGRDLQAELMEKMDLRYALFERSGEGPARHYGGDRSGQPVEPEELVSFLAFVTEHADSIRDLREAIESQSVGYFT